MPVQASPDQLRTYLRKSGLLTPAQLETHCPADSKHPAALLDSLISNGLLTRYQADKIAAGKYKGFVLGPYTVLDRIGGGGIGHVFLAEHAAMRRLVALKVLSFDSANDAVTRERFFREARAAASLDHPNIIRAFDLRHENNVFYFVMEYLDGDSLQHVVGRHAALDWRTAAHYAKQIANGLQHAHENGLVHRDIKPANLLLGRDGLVKILDLGLVRSLDDTESKLTEKLGKNILGTADYLAPEQAVNSSQVDIRADIYSLGATLYFMLSGRPLFVGGKAAQKLMWQQLKEPIPIRQLVPEIPEGLAAVVHKCLAKKPDERYAEPQELSEALNEFAAGVSPVPRADVMPPPMPRRVWSQRLPEAPQTISSFTLPGMSMTNISLPPLPSLDDTNAGTRTPQTTRGSHLFLAGSGSVATMSDVQMITPRESQTIAEPLISVGSDSGLWRAALVVVSLMALVGMALMIVFSRRS